MQLGRVARLGGDEMEMPDFFDIVTVLDSERTKRWGIAGEEGVILGKSTDDDTPNGVIVRYGRRIHRR
jgi:hypothetical protein